MIVNSERPLATDTFNSSAPAYVVPRSISRVLGFQSDQGSRLAFLTDPTGLAVEQYKLLRGRLNAMHPKGGILLITSSSPAEGKTLTSINLSWSLAEGGFRTCLVDLDFRLSGVAKTLHLDTNDGGVGEVLVGERTLGQTLWQIGDRPFHVLPVATSTDSPSQYLSARVLGPLLQSLRAVYRWVVLDLPPAFPLSDVSEVISQVDTAVMVVRAGKTTDAFIRPTLDILGKKLSGVVLNGAYIRGSSYYKQYGYLGKR